MFKKLLKALNKSQIKLYYWWLTRKLSDASVVEIPIPDFENNIYLVSLSGNLARPFAWVELNLIYDSTWEDDHVRAFYQSMLDLIEAEQLTESLILMHLHPETYELQEHNDDEAYVDFRPE